MCYPGSRDDALARFIEYGLLGLLIFAPLPAGSVYEWSILGIQLTVLAMFTAHILMKHKLPFGDLLKPALKWP